MPDPGLDARTTAGVAVCGKRVSPQGGPGRSDHADMAAAESAVPGTAPEPVHHVVLLYTYFLPGAIRDELSLASAHAVCQRNVTRLHQAASFVLKKNIGKLFAEAFELLASRPQLTDGLIHASGMSEAELGAAVKAAENFVKSSYPRISGVVRDKGECHAGEGTQIDGLDADFWFRIASCLKLSDILDEHY